MGLLVLGGTGFVGRTIVEEALARGWAVHTFNRGTREPPDGVTALRGDRTAPGGLAALDRPALDHDQGHDQRQGQGQGQGQGHAAWDAVVDTWSGAPVVVRDAARLLATRAARYVYISSRSVYASPAPIDAAEDAPLVEAAPGDGEVEYARAKAGGELAAIESFGDRALLVRAGLILGPNEDIGRLPWWLLRLARGGPVPAPGPAGLEIQYIDVRDLAVWTLDAIESGLSGPYNLVGRTGHATIGRLLEACVRVTGGAAELRWISPEAVRAAGVEPWIELPIWLPPGELHDSTYRSDVSKAIATGLTCRPIEDTVADTWAWMRSLGGKPPQRSDRPSVGLGPEAEARLLGS